MITFEQFVLQSTETLTDKAEEGKRPGRSLIKITKAEARAVAKMVIPNFFRACANSGSSRADALQGMAEAHRKLDTHEVTEAWQIGPKAAAYCVQIERV